MNVIEKRGKENLIEVSRCFMLLLLFVFFYSVQLLSSEGNTRYSIIIITKNFSFPLTKIFYLKCYYLLHLLYF